MTNWMEKMAFALAAIGTVFEFSAAQVQAQNTSGSATSLAGGSHGISLSRWRGLIEKPVKTQGAVRLLDRRCIRSFAFGALALTIPLGQALAQESSPKVPDVEKREAAQVTRPIAAGKKPNVVFILADNVGYGDLGSYGGGELRGAPTPRLDQLAQQGLRFTPIPRRTRVHTVANCAHDRSILDPQWSFADHRSRNYQYSPRACVHDG